MEGHACRKGLPHGEQGGDVRCHLPLQALLPAAQASVRSSSRTAQARLHRISMPVAQDLLVSLTLNKRLLKPIISSSGARNEKSVREVSCHSCGRHTLRAPKGCGAWPEPHLSSELTETDCCIAAMFGQLVIGAPGSGKTTYCRGICEFLNALGR